MIHLLLFFRLFLYSRLGSEGKLSVQRLSDVEEEDTLMVSGSTQLLHTRLTVDEDTKIYIGGLPRTYQVKLYKIMNSSNH